MQNPCIKVVFENSFTTWNGQKSTWYGSVSMIWYCIFPNKAWILFLHRKLYVLIWWSALFFFLCHNNKRIPTEWSSWHQIFLTLSQAEPDITYFLLISSPELVVISDKKHISWSPLHLGTSSIFRGHYELWYDDMIWWLTHERAYDNNIRRIIISF